MIARLLFTAALLALWCVSRIVAAGESVPRQAATLYLAKSADANLLDIFPDTLKGELHWNRPYFAGASYLREFDNPGALQHLLDAVHLPGVQSGAEVVAGQHWQPHDLGELAAAYRLETPAAELRGVTVRFAAGMGLSYVFGRPAYEEGPKDDPERRYRLLNFNIYELEWGLASTPGWSLVTSIHHRSGIYGLIAPRHVGSNFVTVGLRAGF